MGKIIQQKGIKGSLKWTQYVINDFPANLDNSINKFLPENYNQPIEWLSPLTDDDYAEYRGQTFLDLLVIKLAKKELKDFWPSRGPQWDALGRIKNEAYFLIEAKAHVSEIISSSQAKAESSVSLINKSLKQTKKYLNLKQEIDLTKGFYQYSNRLAHLYLLRVLNNIPAYQVFVYFLNDHTHIPTSLEEFNGALQLMHSLLGTHKHKLSKYVFEIFIDIEKLK